MQRRPVPLQRLYLSFFYFTGSLCCHPGCNCTTPFLNRLLLELLSFYYCSSLGSEEGEKQVSLGSARDECHQIVFLQLLNKTSNAVP